MQLHQSRIIETLELLIFGYISAIEKQEKLFMLIPQSIYDLIYLFYSQLLSPRLVTLISKTETTSDSDGYWRSWSIGCTIKKGHYSCVKKAVDRTNGKHVAIKFIKKSLNVNDEWKKLQEVNIKNEIEALKRLKHEHIIQLLAYDINTKHADHDDIMLMILEYTSAGQLFDILYYTEKLEPILARTYFHQLVEAIEYMHKNGVIHRDIKPQSLLLDNKFNLKITGFASCKICETGNSNIQMNDWEVGSRGYQAPEILLRNKHYDNKVDIFSMGVVLFILLGGYPPFEHAKASDKWYQFIIHKKYKNFWKSHRNCGLRQQETDLITRMICFDVNKRISIEKIKKHSWYTNTEILQSSELINVFRLRHQQMEQQRNNDPNKQKILQNSVKGTLVPQIYRQMKTMKNLPPNLPVNESINPYDIYTSSYNTAYEVLIGLENAVTYNLNGTLIPPNHGKIDMYDDDIDTQINDDFRTYIDIVNFSLMFKAALQDLDTFTHTDTVYIHIGLYYCDIAECNLAKFTCLSGDRRAFRKLIERLSTYAGIYLTGLDKKSFNNIVNKRQNNDVEELCKICFPHH